MTTVLAVASVITAVSVIVTFLITAYKFIRKFDKWKEEKDEHDRENYLNILRLIIMNDNIPIEERIAAGDKYIKEGGNGAVKHHYLELLEQLPHTI